MTTVAVIDIDTTLADCDHRAAHLVKDESGKITQASWDTFLDPELMTQDTPVPHAREVIDSMRQKGYQIVFLTGRNERLRSVTEAWLREHIGYNTHTELLLMRPQTKDSVPASVCKQEMFDKYVRRWTAPDVSYLFFEDDAHVLGVWQKYGLVFKCPEAWATMNPAVLEGDEPSWKR